MTSLSYLAKTLIKEASKSTSVFETVYKAIQDRNLIVIYYDAEEEEGVGMRTVEPVCLGKTWAGNLAFRAWEREGASYSAYIGQDRLPGWRLFRIDRVLGIVRSTKVFDKPRPGYNLTGDDGLARVYVNAKFPIATSKVSLSSKTGTKKYTSSELEDEFEDYSY